MQKTVYFVRHGETEYNRKHIIQGRGVDSDLNKKGQAQAQLLHKAYGAIDFDLVVYSSLKRTKQTLAHFLLADRLVWSSEDIDEIGWGDHEGKRATKKMKRAFDQMLTQWKSQEFDARLSGGESLLELKERVTRFLEELANRPERNIIVCSHGRTLMCMMCLVGGDSLTQMYKYSQSNTAVNIAHYDQDSWSLEKIGDTAHLKVEKEL